jgi:hypothetical protein
MKTVKKFKIYRAGFQTEVCNGNREGRPRPLRIGLAKPRRAFNGLDEGRFFRFDSTWELPT